MFFFSYKISESLLESDRIFCIFCKLSSLLIMAMEFPLSDFGIIKLSFFDGDFKDANSSLVKFKGALFLLYELNDEIILQSFS